MAGDRSKSAPSSRYMPKAERVIVKRAALMEPVIKILRACGIDTLLVDHFKIILKSSHSPWIDSNSSIEREPSELIIYDGDGLQIADTSVCPQSDKFIILTRLFRNDTPEAANQLIK